MIAHLKIAVTETCNAYPEMPSSVEHLAELSDRLEEIRYANIEHNGSLIQQAAGRGASIVGLGELCTAPYFALRKDAFWRAMAEDVERGPSASRLRELARALEVVIVAPLYERCPESGKRYNTAVVIDADGELLGKFRKLHIPHGENERGKFVESFYFGPADAPPYFPVFETRYGRVGVAICYDRHFEGVMRTFAERGAELVFSPAVTFGAKSERMWELEFEVDAARHNIFIAGSNRLGVEPPYTQHYFGRSYVVGPDGRAASDRSVPGLVIAEIDLEELRRPDPSGWALTRHRRPDIYGGP